MIIGVLSDTHGTLHPRLPGLCRAAGVEHILHAGDVGSDLVLRELGGIAPVSAVQGNIDTDGEVAQLPVELRFTVEGVDIYMTHIGGKPKSWLPSLPNPKPSVAICGHSHIPLAQTLAGVLFLNPGAAGRRPRFGKPLSAALLRVNNSLAEVEIITL